MVPMNILIDDFDKEKSREQLIRELVELRVRLADEKKRCHEISLELFELKFKGLSKKNTLQFQNTSIDDINFKQTDNATAHQSELLESIFNNIPILLVLWDPRLRRFRLNRYAERVIGWTTEEANEIDFMREIYPDAAYRAEVESFMLSLKPEWHEWKLHTKAREYVPIYWINIYLTDETMIGIGVDLRKQKKTEQLLKLSEERYGQLLSILPAAMYTCDENGLITYYNEQAARLWGRSPQLGEPDELFRGSFRFYCLDGSPIPQDQIPMAAVLRYGNKVRAKEVTIERPDGSVLFVSVNIDPLRDATGRINGAINVFMDITAHKQTEAALYRLNETLEQQVAERTEIAKARARQLQSLTEALINAEEKERRRIAMLMHDDLQQILVSAKFQAEMLMAPLKNETANIARTLLDTLSKAIDSCRTLSHELNPSSIYGHDLNSIIKKIVEQMKKNHGLKVESTVEFHSGRISEDIKIFISRTVQELLFNCAKHARSKRVNLEISRRGNFMTVIVKDDGVGFDPGLLKIRGGTKGGIGLFSIQERTEALGGTFTFESAPNEGSCFILSVPLKTKFSENQQFSISEIFKMLIEGNEV
jgi:PAS domain S-box-containing protein